MRSGILSISYWGCALFWALLGVGLCSNRALAKGAGEVAPVAAIGVNFHTGVTGKSLTGALGQYVAFRAEARKGYFRPNAACEVQSSVGKASIGSDTPAATIYGSGFLAGFHVFLFPTGRFQPFFGGNGVFSWHFMKLASPPTGVEPYTQGLSYGYEASAGVDIRMGSQDGTALRIRSGFWSVGSQLAGVSGFQLNGFRFELGLVW